jgi:AraC-like DNA-binding protein
LINTLASLLVQNLENFEELGEAVWGARREIVQLGHGRVHGFMAHLSIHDLPVDFGEFSVGIRSRGVFTQDRITITMITGCTDLVTHRCCEVKPGDVLVPPPGTENERLYRGGASYSVISLAPADIISFFGSEPRVRDLDFWQRNHFRAAPHSTDDLITFLRNAFRIIRDPGTTITAEAAEFLKRAIIENMTAPLMIDLPTGADTILPSATRIVRRVEDYLDRAGTSTVHVSEICNKLHISRRSLHRAFHETLGIGPINFLQHKRLCSAYSVLRNGDPKTTNVMDVALQHGFTNVGRFCGYYRALFDEYPSETAGRSHPTSSSKRSQERLQFAGAAHFENA